MTPTVLLVDREKDFFNSLVETYPDMDLLFADNCNDGLQMSEQSKPHLVLVDADTHYQSGGQAHLEALVNSNQSYLIMLANNGDMDLRIRSYQDGAIDVIEKNSSNEEIKGRLAFYFDMHKRIQQGQLQLREAQQSAFQAMTSAGELGVIMAFMRKSYHIHTLQDLAAQVVGAVGQYGLNCAVQIRSELGQVDLNTQGKPNPLEAELCHKLAHHGPIYDFENRTIFSYSKVSILIKNMPLDEQDRYGRIKDNVALLCEAASSREQTLTTELKLASQSESMTTMLQDTRQILNGVKLRHNDQLVNAQHHLSDMMVQLERALISADLSEEQENDLLSTTSNAVDEAMRIVDVDQGVARHLEFLIDQLEDLLE